MELLEGEMIAPRQVLWKFFVAGDILSFATKINTHREDVLKEVKSSQAWLCCNCELCQHWEDGTGSCSQVRLRVVALIEKGVPVYQVRGAKELVGLLKQIPWLH